MNDKKSISRFSRRLWGKTLLAAVLGIALFIDHHIYGFIPRLNQTHGRLIWLIIGPISCLLVLYCGSYIYRTAWTALRVNETNKNTLIALGTLILLVYSMLRIIFPATLAPLFVENYFLSAILIIALADFATLLEMRAKRGNESLLHHLRQLLPRQATIVSHAGDRTIATAELKPGDTVKVDAGEVFAADGVIINGETKVDQSKLNGDPIPVSKKNGDEVIAGSLNKTIPVLYKVTYVGKHTVLSHIINVIAAAQISKTRSSRLMAIFTAVFIPLVLLFAVFVVLIWYNFGPSPYYVHAMIRAVTVLVIASPTALVISIPLPILVGIGKSAQYGILIRNAQTLVKAAKIDTVIFDKSGILTRGKPNLVSLHPHRQYDANLLLQYAASIENRYEHPIANAIVAAAKDRNIELLTVENFAVTQGQGISAMINGQYVNVGSRQFIQRQGIALNGLTELIQRTAQQGYTILLVAIEKQVIGLLALQDDLRKDTYDAIMRLNKLGIQPVIFTADSRAAAETLGRKLGIKQIFSNITPQGKLKEIERLQHQGKIVALVAEGASDALALARADISIAVATHSHLMLDTANINLMRQSLHSVADTICIARATRNKIKQNLFISTCYNFFAILFAAGALYPVWHWLLKPTEATILMTAVTLSIILNANRLLHFKPFQSLRRRYLS